MSVRRSFHVTKGGWALLAVGTLLALGAFNASLNMTYLLASLLIGIFLIALVAPLWSTGRVDCRRTLAELPRAGQTFKVELRVESRRRTTARFLALRDPLCRLPSGETAQRLLLRLRPAERIILPVQGGPLRRGAHCLPGVSVACGFPFGVAESLVRAEGEEELLVYPAQGALSLEMSLALKAQGTRVGAPNRVGIPSEEFRAVREYRPGDNPRRIHWRATAHHGTLHVREMERERFAPMLLILDSRIPAALPPDERRRAQDALELAVSFAAEVCRTAQRERSGVALLAFFPAPRLLRVGPTGEIESAVGEPPPLPALPPVATSPGARLPYGPNHVLTALARLQPSSGERAGELTDILNAVETAQLRRVLAVTPTRRTALGLRALADELSARLLIAAEPGFSAVFRLSAPEGEAPA